MDRISMITALFARALAIKSIGGDSLSYIGVTTTALSDGATTNPITIDGDTVTATNGNVALYGGDAFVFNGTIWQASSAISQIFTEIGDLSDLDTEAKTDLVSAINEVNEEKQDDVELSLTPTAVVSDRDIQDGQGNTLSVLAEALTKTASGNPVVISDCAGGKARSLKTTINAIQDLHGLPFPYVGGAYKNKYVGSPSFDGYVNPRDTWVKQAETYNGHEVYKKSGEAWSGIYKRFYLPVGTYTFSVAVKTSGNGDDVALFTVLNTDEERAIGNDLNKNTTATNSWTVISNTFTITTAGYVCPRIEKTDGTGDIYISEYQLEVGSTATSFAPYSNICPISGRDRVAVDDVGKNIYSQTNEQGVIYGDGTEATVQNRCRTSGYISIEGNNQYTLKTYNSNAVYPLMALFYDADKNYIGYTTPSSSGYVYSFTSLPNAEFVRFDFNKNNANFTPSEIGNCQLEYGDTATAYEPYAHSSATIQLGQTVYGADINWDTGVATVKTAKIDFGTLNYLTATVGGKAFYYADVPNAPQRDYTAISSDYPVTNSESEFLANDGIARAYGTTLYGGFARVSIIDSRYSGYTTAQFKEAMSGVDYEYELATPTTLQLTPTEVQMLKGYNRVTIDDGTITLDYIAKAISGNDEEIAPLVGDKATKSYTVNDFIERADGLYRVTASIASGASFTANNTVKMSIGEALTYLYNK